MDILKGTSANSLFYLRKAISGFFVFLSRSRLPISKGSGEIPEGDIPCSGNEKSATTRGKRYADEKSELAGVPPEKGVKAMSKLLAGWLGVLALWPLAAGAVEVSLRDISRIQGLRENQLIGYGLVVGLQGTGDSRNSVVTSRSLANMLEKFGLNLSQQDFTTRNAAAVMVTATLMPFMQPGGRIDVEISSLGDAKSLQGGTLLLTTLYAGNQQALATAQGQVSVGGYYAGQSRQQIMKNVTTAGRIPDGGIVERQVTAEYLKDNKFTLTLEKTDFILANRTVERLNSQFGANTAATSNGTDIEIALPAKYQNQPAAFVAEVQGLKVESENAARIVLDERTGTVVIGGDVRISRVAISHGGLHIAIAGETKISQPQPYSDGHTVVAQDLAIRADERINALVALPEGTSIEELVRVLNKIGTLPRDMIVILENLKAAGALHGTIAVR